MGKRIYFLFIIANTVLLLGGCAKNPVTGESQFMIVDQQRSINQGRELYPKLTQMNNGELPAPELQAYVNKLGQQIAAMSHQPDLPFKFNVVNTATPNAYALPGGYISITRGLILEMDSEDQLAAVIGHEIVHATARHSAAQRSKGIAAQLVLGAGSIYLQSEGVDNAALYAGLGGLGAQAYLADYSREQESQADRIGMEYMAKAGYDPQGMVKLQKLFLRLRKNKPGLIKQFFSSHPLTEKRVAQARKHVQSLQEKIDIPVQEQHNRFEQVVIQKWKPRRPAYEKLKEAKTTLVEKDQPTQAITTLREARAQFNGDGLIHAWYGAALTGADRAQEGREAINKARQLNPDVYRIELISALNHYRLEQYSTSLDSLKRAEKLLGPTPMVVYYKGRNYEELKQRKKAAQAYKAYLNHTSDGERARHARSQLKEWGYLNEKEDA